MSTLAYFMSCDKGKCLHSLNQSVSTTLHWYPSASSLRSICSYFPTLLVPDIWLRPLSGGPTVVCCRSWPCLPSLAGRVREDQYVGYQISPGARVSMLIIYGSVDLWSRRVASSRALWDISLFLCRRAFRLINLSSKSSSPVEHLPISYAGELLGWLI